MTTPALELRAGALRLALRPDLGGCIAGLWRDGLPVLHSTEPLALQDAGAAACHPLAPYANRLGYRRFRWLGQDHGTAPNVDGSPHSVHGVAWQRPWVVVAGSACAAELVYVHEPDAHWPFAFEVRQHVALGERELALQLDFGNRAEQPQPVGLGWHPSFPKRQRSRLHLEVSDRWEADATGLPTRRVPQPGIDGDLAHLAFDHCFEGWRGAARLRDEKHSLRLSSSLPYVAVCTPAQRDCYSVAPASHVSNAIHMADPQAHGLKSVAPGERVQAWMKLEVAAV